MLVEVVYKVVIFPQTDVGNESKFFCAEPSNTPRVAK